MKRGWRITIRIVGSTMIYLATVYLSFYLYLRPNAEVKVCDTCFPSNFHTFFPGDIISLLFFLIIPAIVIALFNFLVFKKKK